MSGVALLWLIAGGLAIVFGVLAFKLKGGLLQLAVIIAILDVLFGFVGFIAYEVGGFEYPGPSGAGGLAIVIALFANLLPFGALLMAMFAIRIVLELVRKKPTASQ